MSSRTGRSNHARFPQHFENGKWHCRICKTPLPGKKRSFCSHRCVRDFFMLTDWGRVREVIYARDGGICMKCGKRVFKLFHVDHIIPISKGGSEWELSNLELSCIDCNLKKGSKFE